MVSTTELPAGTPGLLQNPVLTHGDVGYTTATKMPSVTAAFVSTAFLLVASGIKYINYSDAVALWQITNRA